MKVTAHPAKNLFPVCTGINRSAHSKISPGRCVPRMHGDKPLHGRGVQRDAAVFPVCTGINRLGNMLRVAAMGVPRMHGDKPSILPSAIRLIRYSTYSPG